MPSPTLTLHIQNPPPDAAPLTVTELCALLDTLITGAINGDYVPYVISQTTPAVDDQDKAWLRLDNAGRPIGTFIFYGGNWRKTYTAALGDIKMFSGDPSIDFDADGLGTIGSQQDGWQIANGKNGSINLSNMFIAAANMDSSGGKTQYDAGWQSFVDGLDAKKTGGAKDYKLSMIDLPNIRVKLTGFHELAGSGQSVKQPIITGNYIPSRSFTQTIGNFGSDEVPEDPEVPPTIQTKVPVIPPFFALCFCQFVGF